MILIKNTLSIGDVVDSGDRTVLYTKGLVQYIDNRCQAVGSA